MYKKLFITFLILSLISWKLINKFEIFILFSLIFSLITLILFIPFVLEISNKKCPYCQEWINKKAIKCPHCQSMIK